MFSEDDLLPISGLQHLAFCERQWALIHIEGVWTENRLTVEGRHLHERVDLPGTQGRGDVRIARALSLHSLRLGLVGRADAVEFHRIGDDTVISLSGASAGVALPGVEGWWRPFPVEYKRGRAKRGNCDRAQLCAQALCLEEMFAVGIAGGALFYGQSRRRTAVDFDAAIRRETEALAERMHVLFNGGRTPRARYEAKCDNCSLYDACLPKTTGPSAAVDDYLSHAVTPPEAEA
jgi:CRISPR-associated exonuclease Cas4